MDDGASLPARSRLIDSDPPATAWNTTKFDDPTYKGMAKHA